MDTKKMMVCALVLVILIATSCKAKYAHDDSEEAKPLGKRQVDSFSITLHWSMMILVSARR
jgi:hypothetical protein